MSKDRIVISILLIVSMFVWPEVWLAPQQWSPAGIAGMILFALWLNKKEE